MNNGEHCLILQNIVLFHELPVKLVAFYQAQEYEEDLYALEGFVRGNHNSSLLQLGKVVIDLAMHDVS